MKGEWEIALHTWFNLSRNDAYFYWRTKPTEPATESPVAIKWCNGGYYDRDSISSMLVVMLIKINSDIHVVYDSIQKKFDFDAGSK